MKKDIYFAYCVLVSVLLEIIGVVVRRTLGSVLFAVGSVTFLIFGTLIAVKEIKSIRLKNYKRLFYFFVVSYILSFVIILSGYATLHYLTTNPSSFSGWDAIGYFIFSVFVMAVGALFIIGLTVGLAIRIITNTKHNDDKNTMAPPPNLNI